MTTPHPLAAISTFSTPGRRGIQEDYAVSDFEKRLAIVADGFGGAEPGFAAARMACESVRSFLFKEAGDLEATLPFMIRPYFSLAGNVLFNALIHANREVRKLNNGKGANSSGAASVVAGFLDGDLLALGSVGGCEAWIFRDGESARLVQPRTYAWLRDPIAGRRVTADSPANASSGGSYDAMSAALEAAPLRAIGMADDLEPELVEVRVRPGDWVLFCTDGIDSVARERLAQAHRMGGRAEDAEAILREWKGMDFTDNATAAVWVVAG